VNIFSTSAKTLLLLFKKLINILFIIVCEGFFPWVCRVFLKIYFGSQQIKALKFALPALSGNVIDENASGEGLGVSG